MNVELVIDARCELSEGPVWDSRSEQLYWVDIEGSRLHACQLKAMESLSWNIGCKIGAAVPRESGGMMLATEHGFELLDPENSQKQTLVDPEADRRQNRFNDGKCDSRGRFWAGTMSMAKEPKAGSLYVLEPNHTFRHVLDGVTTSNGLGWSPDDATMYYIDTPTMMARAFDFDVDSGTLSNERVAVHFPDGVGRPDGMTIDAEGMLWIAHWDGGQITRWDPNQGRLLETVRLPVDRVTSCAFGGPDYETLFITTAWHGLDDAQRAAQPHAGSIFAIEPSTGGLPSYRFAG